MGCRYAQMCRQYHSEKAECRFESVAIEQCIAFHRFRQHERKAVTSIPL
jgi:hypothetical protein